MKLKFLLLTLSLVCLSTCLADSEKTNHFKLWWQGHQYRLSLPGQPVHLAFTAVDGRTVDISQMHGKVVLVDFWETDCEPCVAELPRIKAALTQYQSRGFAVIGISSDTKKDKLEKFLKTHDISWPQYFEGQVRNKFTTEYGIDGFPHMFLVDKRGCFRFDDVMAIGSKTNFEARIESLLKEK